MSAKTKKPVSESFGASVRRRREALNLTQRQFAAVSGIAANRLSVIELGASPKPEAKETLVRTLQALETEHFGSPELSSYEYAQKLLAIGTEVSALANDPQRDRLFWEDLIEYAEICRNRLKKKYGEN